MIILRFDFYIPWYEVHQNCKLLLLWPQKWKRNQIKLYFDYFVCYYDWTIYEHMINYTSRHLNVSLRTGPGPQNRCQYITDFKSIFIGVTVEVSFGYKHGLKVYFMGYLCANFHAFLQLWNIKNLNNCTIMGNLI